MSSASSAVSSTVLVNPDSKPPGPTSPTPLRFALLQQLKRKLVLIDDLARHQAFVDRLDTEAADRLFFSALQQFGRSLNLEVVAEGVERRAQLAAPRALQCDLVQGYHPGRPATGRAIRKTTGRALSPGTGAVHAKA